MFSRKRQEKGPLHLSEPFSSISFGPGQQTSPPWIIAPIPSDQPCGSFLPVPAETSSMTLYRFSLSHALLFLSIHTALIAKKWH
jgi:hypothetical protein